jgi:hypothetical protein
MAGKRNRQAVRNIPDLFGDTDLAAPVYSYATGPESDVIIRSRKSVSEANWEVGRTASEWLKRFARGRTDADFAELVGLTSDQVYARRRVWEKFGDVRGTFPRLLWQHFYAALDWDDATECLTWANDIGATVAEMRAWRRAQRGEDLSVE